MLNTFPTLLAFGLFAPLFLRLILGLTLFFFGLETVTKHKDKYTNKFKNLKYPFPNVFVFILGILEILSGIFITIGLYTQISSLVVIYLLINLLIIERKDKVLKHSSLLYLILSIIAFSLLFSGAGFIAFDLPL